MESASHCTVVDNQTTDQFSVSTVNLIACLFWSFAEYTFCPDTCHSVSPFSVLSPFSFISCQDGNKTSIRHFFSSHRGNHSDPSGRFYQPFSVQLNVSLSASRPSFPGAPGRYVQGQLMATPYSESGQLFPPQTAQMPLPAIMTLERQEQLTSSLLLETPKTFLVFFYKLGGLHILSKILRFLIEKQTRRLERKRAEQTDHLETVIHNLEIWKCDVIRNCKYDRSQID